MPERRYLKDEHGRMKAILIRPGMHVVLIYFNALRIGIFRKEGMFRLVTQHWTCNDSDVVEWNS